MKIFAYDQRGIITADRVPRGTSVTAAYYRDWLQKLRRKMYNNACPLLGKVVTDLLSKYKWEVLSHAPYSPDMSPPDFDLFHKL
jgi:hypothetical protein